MPGDRAYYHLGAGILLQALRDWWRVTEGRPTQNQLLVAERMGYGEDSGAELSEFLGGAWVQDLCTALGYDLDVYLAAARRGPLDGVDDEADEERGNDSVISDSQGLRA